MACLLVLVELGSSSGVTVSEKLPRPTGCVQGPRSCPHPHGSVTPFRMVSHKPSAVDRATQQAVFSPVVLHVRCGCGLQSTHRCTAWRERCRDQGWREGWMEDIAGRRCPGCPLPVLVQQPRHTGLCTRATTSEKVREEKRRNGKSEELFQSLEKRVRTSMEGISGG